MAWGTRTIGLGEIARERASQERDDVDVFLEAESIQDLKDGGFLKDDASLDHSGNCQIRLARHQWELLEKRRERNEKNGAMIVRLLREDPAGWDEAFRRVAKARARAKHAPKTEAEAKTTKDVMIALAKEALAKRDPKG
jgi:hypothetical protein